MFGAVSFVLGSFCRVFGEDIAPVRYRFEFAVVPEKVSGHEPPGHKRVVSVLLSGFVGKAECILFSHDMLPVCGFNWR